MSNLYDVLFSFQDVRQRRFDWGGLKHIRVPVHQKGATEDLGLWLVETPAGLRGGVTYNKDVVLTETAQRVRDRYVGLLERVASDPRYAVGALLAPLASEVEAVRLWSSDAFRLERASPGAATVARLYAERLALSPTDRMLVIPERPTAYRAAEVAAAESLGATIVLATPELAVDGDALRDRVERENISVLAADPTTWRALLDAWWTAKPGFKALIDIAEASQALSDALIRAGCRVFAIYRDVETSAALAAGEVRADDGMHFGTPLSADGLRIVDDHGEMVPPGVSGWIATGNTRTQDRARWRGNGTLQWIGADADQLCLNGKRYRLADLENALVRAADRKPCAVIVRESRPGDRRAFVFTEAPSSHAAALSSELMELGLAAELVHMAKLPRAQDGGVERGALAADGSANAERTRRTRAATDTEKMLVEIWSELLGIDRIEMTDNFFALGGTSLLAMQAAERMQSRSGRSTHARRYVFESLAQLALAYDSEAGKQPNPASVETMAPSFFGRLAARFRGPQ